MNVQEYTSMVKAAEQTRETFAIFDPGAGIRRQQELYTRMGDANRVFVNQFGKGSEPPREAELNPASKQAAAKVLDYIVLEGLLTDESVTHYRNLL